jgi:uncharacterized membrane protein (Fun14 family)
MELVLGITLLVLMWIAVAGVIITVPLFAIALTYSWIKDLRPERATAPQVAPARNLAPASRLSA